MENKSFVDTAFSLVPFGILGYGIYQVAHWELDFGIKVFVIFVISVFAVGWFTMGQVGDDSPFRKTLDQVGSVAFFLFMAAIVLAFYYAAFIHIPKIEDNVAVIWTIRGVVLGFTAIVGSFFLIGYLRKRKGSVVIATETDEFETGEEVFGAVQVKLNKSVVVNSLRISLIGYRRERRDDHTVEISIYDLGQEISIKKSNMSNHDNYYEFCLKPDWKKIEDLSSKSRIFWKLYCHLDCSGLDLSSRKNVDLCF